MEFTAVRFVNSGEALDLEHDDDGYNLIESVLQDN